MERKNIRFYLRPQRTETEATAADLMDRMPPGWQTDIARECFMAGMVLRHLSTSLPAYLSTILKPDMDPEMVRDTLIQTLARLPEPTGTAQPLAPATDALSASESGVVAAPVAEPVQSPPAVAQPVQKSLEQVNRHFHD